MDSLWVGAAVGIIGGIPAGPMGALAMEQALMGREKPALGTGLGSSFGMLIWSFAAVSLMAHIKNVLDSHGTLLQILVGCIFLVLASLGIRRHLRDTRQTETINSAGSKKDSTEIGGGRASFFGAAVVSLLRPSTCLIVAGIVSSFFPHASIKSPFLFSISAFSLNFCWFVIVIYTARKLRKMIKPKHISWFRIGLNGLVGISGTVMLVKGLL